MGHEKNKNNVQISFPISVVVPTHIESSEMRLFALKYFSTFLFTVVGAEHIFEGEVLFNRTCDERREFMSSLVSTAFDVKAVNSSFTNKL